MYHLGAILSSGGDSWIPAPQALAWYRKGAEGGDRACMIVMANAYRYGLMGMEKDESQAQKWFTKSRDGLKPWE